MTKSHFVSSIGAAGGGAGVAEGMQGCKGGVQVHLPRAKIPSKFAKFVSLNPEVTRALCIKICHFRQKTHKFFSEGSPSQKNF